MTKYLVTDIAWDIDEDDLDPGLLAMPCGLPVDMTVEIDEDEFDCGDELEEFISDRITDETGYCHNGFKFEKIEE